LIFDSWLGNNLKGKLIIIYNMGNCKSEEIDNTPKINSESWKNFYETQEFINQHLKNILYCHIDDVICYLDSFQ
jgi:hypothetical protein